MKKVKVDDIKEIDILMDKEFKKLCNYNKKERLKQGIDIIASL